MKKVRCPRCSVVNMERFVTFPYCAGCGARLPVAEAKALSAFSRPLGIFLWTSTIGATLLAIFAAARVFEAPVARTEDVSVYSRGPRTVRLGEEFVLKLNIEALEGTIRRKSVLRAVKLRVLRDNFETLTLVEMQPPPDTTTDLGSARYFNYAVFDADDAIRLRLRATRTGHQVMQLRFLVSGQLQGASNFSFDVLPRGAATTRRNVLQRKSEASRVEAVR
jgi:hypothetical protein